MLGICPESGQHISLLFILNELFKMNGMDYLKFIIKNILK